jgi:MFS family permease
VNDADHLASRASVIRWSIASIFFINGFVFASWVPHIPGVMERHALSPGGLGTVLLAMAAGAMVALPFAGAITARFGSRAVTVLCAIVFCLLLPLPVIAPSALLCALALFVFGIVNAVLDVAMNAQGAELEMRMERPIMSSLHGGWSLGGLAGAGSAAALLEAGMGSTMHVAVVAIAGAIAAAFVAGRLLPTHGRAGTMRAHLELPSRPLLAIGALTFAALLIEGAMADWSAVYLRRERGMDAGGAALGYAAFSLAMAACRFAGDAVTRRFGPVALVRGSATIALSGILIVLLPLATSVALAGFVLVGIGMANLIPILFGSAARSNPEHPGTGIAAVATTGYLGFIAGPPAIGWLADLTGLTLALGLLALLCGSIALGAHAVSKAHPNV